MRRRELITALGGVAFWPIKGRAQQAEPMRHIGMLMSFAANDREAVPRVVAFKEGLQQFGWVEGRNIHVEFRWGAGNSGLAQNYAAELVAQKPDVVVGVGTLNVRALSQVTHTIPIVFLIAVDPVGDGLVESLATPGGNITGFSSYDAGMMGKWLQLLKDIAPGVSRVTVIFNATTVAFKFLQPLKSAAAALALDIAEVALHDVADIEPAIAGVARQRTGGFFVIPDNFTITRRETVVTMASRYRVPAIYAFNYFARDSGLMSYGVDTLDIYRRAPGYVDRILRGEKPGQLPVQGPTKFELVINLKTAKALGLNVPDKLLALADEVIE
jgi:putative tryptophan/tyrosine transport system substrate-binding protein